MVCIMFGKIDVKHCRLVRVRLEEYNICSCFVRLPLQVNKHHPNRAKKEYAKLSLQHPLVACIAKTPHEPHIKR
jgi:hypothetical protein